MTSLTLTARTEALIAAMRQQIAQQPDPLRPQSGAYHVRASTGRGRADSLQMHPTDAGWHVTLSTEHLMHEMSVPTRGPEDALWHLSTRIADLAGGPLR